MDKKKIRSSEIRFEIIIFMLVLSLALIISCQSDGQKDSSKKEFGKNGNPPGFNSHQSGNFSKFHQMNQNGSMNDSHPFNHPGLGQEICTEKNEGDDCTIDNPRGEIEGKCELFEGNLVCIPEEVRQHHPIDQE